MFKQVKVPVSKNLSAESDRTSRVLGIPPVIYLAMNKTLRKDTVRMLIGCLGAIDPQALSNHRHSDHGNGNNAVPAVTKSSTTQAWSNNSTIGAGVHGH